MKLFLSGGSKEAFILDKKFIESINKYFSEFNFSNIEMITNLKEIKKEDLNKFGSVYIGGGNTPYLLKELKETGFYEHLKYLIERNIPIAGGSAGAIIFAKQVNALRATPLELLKFT